MCGIVGAVSADGVMTDVLEGLAMLEYRGYDSAGVATVVDGSLVRRRAEGKLGNLRAMLGAEPVDGRAVVGHTRWATHGAPTVFNAHPHCTERVAVVHNGIIENHADLRRELIDWGARFSSETDTEVVTWLIHRELTAGASPVVALRRAAARLEGSYALSVLFAEAPEELLCSRRGSPLAVARRRDGGSMLCSDLGSLGRWADQAVDLEDRDIARLTAEGFEVFNHRGTRVERHLHALERCQGEQSKGDYEHFTLKEIHEQPEVLQATLQAMWQGDHAREVVERHLVHVDRLHIVACGTSYYAGSIAAHWFERLAGIPTSVELASEFRYREPRLGADSLTLFISQSGETADTLAALRYVRSRGNRTLAIVNVEGSSMMREADACVVTRAGREVGVASTKAFTAQLAVQAVLALEAAVVRGEIAESRYDALRAGLEGAVESVRAALEGEEQIRRVAASLAGERRAIYLGRGVHHALALEGALKLKEISYVHAEGFAAGEMKHGPIALIEEGTPVVVLCPPDSLFDKTGSNLVEVASRGARIILITGGDGARRIGEHAESVIELPPDASDGGQGQTFSPLYYAIPLQLLAYYTARARGYDVDKPRNLAKSVTVE